MVITQNMAGKSSTLPDITKKISQDAGVQTGSRTADLLNMRQLLLVKKGKIIPVFNSALRHADVWGIEV
jgi:hypothetical protein